MQISEEWRIIASYVNIKGGIDSDCQSHSLKFDECKHKSLNSELKHLYTAVTRAKCNLWIYDSDEVKRRPMFEYWHKNDLARMVNIDQFSWKNEDVLFSKLSSSEQWQKQGNYFLQKKCWGPAMKCYNKSGDEHMELVAKAHYCFQQAKQEQVQREKSKEHFMDAAVTFLKCDQKLHKVQYISNAAICLQKAKRYKEAAVLFKCLQRVSSCIV